MSASGSTPHLHLSQYDDTDHPSYVSDYTEDMSRIDTGFNLAQSNALTALNRVATLEQSVGSAGAVGQTAMFSLSATTDVTPASKEISFDFGAPVVTFTRNAEPADVPWTWETGGDAVRLRSTDHGVYRVAVEAHVAYMSSADISAAYISLMAGGGHVAPLVHCNDGQGYRHYRAACSFVSPNFGDMFDGYLRLVTIFDGQAASNARIQCELAVDVERLSTEYSQQPDPGQSDGQ